MKIKNKGKVYPSPSSACSPEPDAMSALKLLPAAILTLASLLSLEDREVLAYLIARSLKTTTTSNPSSAVQDSKRKSSTKPPSHGGASEAAKAHKPPVFECGCFDCYTSYWFRWDSSPNRELINQAIEAFEDHLASGEKSKKTARGKRRDKAGRRVGPSEKPVDLPSPAVYSPESVEDDFPPTPDTPASCDDGAVKMGESEEAEAVVGEEVVVEVVSAAETEAEAVKETVMAVARSHKGLARKVLPDVLGLFNSRLWSLWSPNVY